VKQILDNSALSDTIVDAYIVGANALVNDILGTGTSTLLTEIEKWLTAHMISCTRERMAKREAAGGASIEYTGVYGENLSSTSYGQMVMTLDTTGAMAALGGKSVEIYAITSFD
jgi:hypothetical protein